MVVAADEMPDRPFRGLLRSPWNEAGKDAPRGLGVQSRDR